MEKIHSDVLRKNTLALKKSLNVEDTVGDTLFAQSIISEDTHHEISVKAKDDPKEQAKILLLNLPRCGPNAWDAFIGALGASETEANKDLAKTLLESLEKERQQESDDVPRTPDASSWESTSPDWRGSSSSTSEHTVTVDLDDANEVYQMVHSPRGIAYIINNKNFAKKSGMPKRNGTDVDARALDKLWSDLGFQTKMYNDLGGHDMRHELRMLARRDHSGYDCVIVSILTHGVEGKLYGSDGDLVPVEELVTLFNADAVHKSLIGKPRLFFLQACRGDYFDKGVDQTDSAVAAKMLADGPDDVTDGKLRSLPAQGDMFIGYATIPGYVSWRNSERGAWFIQGVVKVFNKFSDKEHLVDLMVRVNRYVAIEFEASGHNKQIPSPIVQLTKKLFFRPGYYRK